MSAPRVRSEVFRSLSHLPPGHCPALPDGASAPFYTQAIALDGKYLNAYINRGYDSATLKGYDRAIADLTRAITLAPDNALAYQDRATAYSGKGDTAKAAADEAKAVSLRQPGA